MHDTNLLNDNICSYIFTAEEKIKNSISAMGKRQIQQDDILEITMTVLDELSVDKDQIQSYRDALTTQFIYMKNIFCIYLETVARILGDTYIAPSSVNSKNEILFIKMTQSEGFLNFLMPQTFSKKTFYKVYAHALLYWIEFWLKDNSINHENTLGLIDGHLQLFFKNYGLQH